MKRFDRSFEMGMHQHPYFELMYAFKGSFRIEYIDIDSGHALRSAVVHTGQFVFIDSQAFHRMVTDLDDEIFTYNIEFEALRPEQYNPGNINNILPINFGQLLESSSLKNVALSETGFAILPDIGQVELYLRTLINLLSEPTDALEHTLAVRCNLLLLFTEISRCAGVATGGTLSYIRKANAYIQQNFNTKLSIDAIANFVGINKAYLQRQYKKYTGSTILAAITDLRIRKSLQFLHTTNLSIEQIAKQSGFQNKAQFNYEFKKLQGMPPSDYRKAHIQNEIDHHYFLYDSRSIPVDPIEDAAIIASALSADTPVTIPPPPEIRAANNRRTKMTPTLKSRNKKRREIPPIYGISLPFFIAIWYACI